MDPLACLIRCDQAISYCDLPEASAALADYRAWRAKGGFEPEVYAKRGDTFAAECERRIESQRKQRSVKLGSISTGTLLDGDLIEAFSIALTNLDVDGAHADLIADVSAYFDTDDTQDACDLVESLQDALQEFAPDYCYFGAHPGDGTDFGFWVSEDWRELATEDGALFVSDLSEVPDNHSGAVVHVNDYDNATLYSADAGTLTEVWAVV